MAGWLLLTTSLPKDNATARMRAWRALKGSGAAVLRDGVYLLPDSSEHQRAFDAVTEGVIEAGGNAYVFNVPDADRYPLRTLFDRTRNYRELATETRACLDAIGATVSSDVSRRARRLRQRFDALRGVDFFPGEARKQVDTMLVELDAHLAGLASPNEPHIRPGAPAHFDRADYHGRMWATRKGLWVDRMASAWLIRRFIDAGARFLWLDSPADCPADALGFDFDGAPFTHLDTGAGTLVSFEALMASFGIHNDDALNRIARIVHALDVGGLPVPEAPGIERLLRGVKARALDDDELLRETSQLFDDLYLAFQEEMNKK